MGTAILVGDRALTENEVPSGFEGYTAARRSRADGVFVVRCPYETLMLRGRGVRMRLIQKRLPTVVPRTRF